MNIKEINGKHYIDAKFVLIDSEEVTFLFEKSKGDLEYNQKPPIHGINDLGWKYKDIHILSDEKPKKGEYVYDYANDKTGIFDDLVVNGRSFSDHSKKIIASTKKLETTNEYNFVKKFTRQIPKEFFEQFVELYNNGNKITDILVEVENVNSGWQSLANSGKVGSTFVPEKFELKIYNSNFINIKSNQKDWNDLAKIGTPDKWMEVYMHYQELLLENDTREFLENIPNPTWDDVFSKIVKLCWYDENNESQLSYDALKDLLTENYNAPTPKNNN